MDQFKTTIILESDEADEIETLQYQMEKLNFRLVVFRKASISRRRGHLEFIRNALSLQEIIDSVLQVVKSLSGKYTFTVIRETAV